MNAAPEPHGYRGRVVHGIRESVVGGSGIIRFPRGQRSSGRSL